MKSVAIWILRYLLIPAGFIWATGIFNTIKLVLSEESTKDIWSVFSDQEMSTLEITPLNLRVYADSLIEERTKLVKETNFYPPYLYFRDLKQFNMFESRYKESLENNPKSREVFWKTYGLTINFKKGDLMQIRDANWRKIDWDEISKKDSNQKEFMTINEARDYWFPKMAEEEAKFSSKSSVEIWSGIVSSLLGWFSRFYLKGLPVAFILFLIWRTRLKSDTEDWYWGDDERPSFESGFAPLSFLVSLIFWPVILFKHIKDNLNNNLRRAELLSRKQKMLSLLSKQDKELYALSKKMSLKEFRVHLDTLGLKRRHSLVIALFVTFFFVFIVKIPASVKCPITIDCMITNVVLLDHDVGSNYFLVCDYDGCAMLPSVGCAEKTSKTRSIFSSSKLRALTGFTRLIDGIPKF